MADTICNLGLKDYCPVACNNCNLDGKMAEQYQKDNKNSSSRQARPFRINLSHSSYDQRSMLFSETHIMVIGGRLDNSCSGAQGTCNFNNEPMFFSLNPTLAPLPSCLSGNKTRVDCEERVDPALIMTHGMLEQN